MAIRQTWAGMTETNVPGVNVKAVFLLGRARSPSVQERILKENDKYKDIVQQDFAEHYRNLTRKTILLLNWAADYCAGAHYVIKIDDDVFLNTKNMLEFLRQAPRTGLYLGDAKIDTEPLRDAWSKWYTPEEAWPAHVYPPYNNGPAYVMSMDVVRIAKTASKKHVIFPWEDVYVGNLLLNTTISPLPHHSFDTNDIFRDPCSLAVGLASHHFTPQMHYKFWNQLKSCRKNRYNCCKKQQGYKRESPRLPANLLETSIYDQTAYLRQTCNQGDHQTGIRLLILVMSSSQRYETRRFARLTWTNLDTDNGRKVATFFVVGKSAKPHINRFIENENFVYRDILQIDMRDKTSRRYLNVKELLAIKVTAEICHSVPHVMVISDDVFVNFRNVIDFLEKYPHSKLNLKGGHFCYDENCTCIDDPRGRSLKSVNDQNVYDDGDYNEGVDGGGDKGTQQQTMSSLSSIFLLNNDTTALIAQSLRRLKKIPTNLYLEKMLERVGKDISTHPGLDVVGTSMGGDGLDSDQNKATVCWLHKTMASKTFVQSTMALIARKLHDGDYFQCHGNEFKPDVLAVYDCDRGVYARTGQKWQQIQEPIVSVKTSADIIINHPEKCQRKNGLKKNIFMLIVVMSSPEDQDYRAAIRATWGNTANEIKEDIVVLFMMGASMNAAQQFEILREDGMFGDIIQGNFPDNFHNQTSKTLTMVKWANTYCEGAKYVMKVRSDMFVNIHKLVNFLSHPPPHLQSGWAIGRLLVDMHPIRDPHHKYYTSLDVYPDDTFPPYLGATCYVMTSDVVQKVRQILPPSAAFPWEDVYMGMLLQKVGVELLDHAFFSGGSILDNLLPCEMQLYFSWRVREPLSTYNYQEELQNTDIAACPSEKYNDVTRIEFKIRPNR
ncbi:uncharacterized protein [Ptychodera flava]|uniref:uncharacterized protein n=1 Tax=Ptychodera flava TaxID=63121 RepID=UPI00396A81CF